MCIYSYVMIFLTIYICKIRYFIRVEAWPHLILWNSFIKLFYTHCRFHCSVQTLTLYLHCARYHFFFLQWKWCMLCNKVHCVFVCMQLYTIYISYITPHILTNHHNLFVYMVWQQYTAVIWNAGNNTYSILRLLWYRHTSWHALCEHWDGCKFFDQN